MRAGRKFLGVSMNEYIVQYMTKYLDIERFRKIKENVYLAYADKTIVNPDFLQLYDYPHCMILAEPGYGKTRLLKEIVLQAGRHNKKAFFIDSKKVDSDIAVAIKKCKPITSALDESQIQKEWLFSNTLEFTLDENTIICLDALDELPFSRLYAFFEMIESFIREHPSVHLFVSCRIHHLQKIDFDLQTLPFEYIELSQFGNAQISMYLKNNIQDYEAVNEKIKSNGLLEFLSIPRYLYYFVELIKDRKIENVLSLTRIELFENFIYRKLDKERDKKIPHAQYDVIKRVLEKIALLMKIYQVSQLSKDELMTIFDRMDSAFSGIIFRDDLLMILYERSVLKDNIDSIEFENKEFLDFLAVKELLRFQYVEQVFFDLAFEPYLKEIYAEWFYVLPFLLEQNERLLAQFVDYLLKNINSIYRDEYFEALVAVEPRLIKPEMKIKIFHLVFDYYTLHNKWLKYSIANKLYGFYSATTDYKKIILSTDDTRSAEQLYIARPNAISLISSMIQKQKLTQEQVDFWKTKFSEWLHLEPFADYSVLHGAIVSCMPKFAHNDFDFIKKHRFIFENGVELQNDYASACFEVMPEDSFSIDTYFEAQGYHAKNKLRESLVSIGNIEYIFELKTPSAIAYTLKYLQKGEDKQYLYILLSESSFSGRDGALRSFFVNIENVINQEIVTLLHELAILLIEDRSFNYDSGKNDFLTNILKLLIAKDDKYILELPEILVGRNIYAWEFKSFVLEYLTPYFNNKNFEQVCKKLKNIQCGNYSYQDMLFSLYMHSGTSEDVKKYIFRYNKNFIKGIQKQRQKYHEEQDKKAKKQKTICEEWEYKIEPEPDTFMTDLFRFYKQHRDVLTQCTNYKTSRARTIELARNTLREYNPLSGTVKKTGEMSHSISYLSYFRDCIKLLSVEAIELMQEEIDNTFRHLPFDINSDYKDTLKLAKNPSAQAIQDVIDVYAGKRDDDLATYHPQNFLEIYKHFRWKEAEPLLLAMATDKNIAEFIKVEIVKALPIEVLTKDRICELLRKRTTTQALRDKLLAILVQKHYDEDAFKKVIGLVKKKACKAKVSDRESSIHGTSLDFTYNPLVLALIGYGLYRKDIDEEFLVLASKLRDKNQKINAQFLEDIVFGHIKFLQNNNSFEPLHRIEAFLQKNKSLSGLHWFEYRYIELKNLYLEKMAKPSNITEVIGQYHGLVEKEYLKISSPTHLLDTIKDIIDKDLRLWIEGEGAYKYINKLAKKDNNTNAEDFIQKTIKSQIELVLLRRGFRAADFRIKREEQLLDDKRVDFTISYGFAGQVLVELKLGRNSEAKAGWQVGKKYVKTLRQYINGTNSDFGIFLIFNIDSELHEFDGQMHDLKELYLTENNIRVMGINCKVNM
jgi:hypothetical protein